MPTDQPTTKGGNIILKRVDTPNRVEPGEGYEVDVKVSNGALWTGPMDPDSCGSSDPGYRLRVVLNVDGERFTKGPNCHLAAAIRTGDETYTFELRAPKTGGEVDVEAHIEMVGSRKKTDPTTSHILVDENQSEEAEPPGGNDDSGGSDDLPARGDADGDRVLNFIHSAPNDPNVPDGPGRQVDKVLLAVGLLAVAWFASSSAEVLS